MSDRPTPRPWTHVSASQIATWRRCPRRHFYEKRYGVVESPTPAMRRGTEIHRQIEMHLKHGTPPTDVCALVALEHLPDPNEVTTDQVEHPFVFEHPMLPVPFKGMIDFLEPHRITDHKSTSDFRYAKDEEVLLNDPQAVGYAWYSVSELGYPLPIEVRLLYLRTRQPAKALPRSITFDRETLTSGCRELATTVRQMAETMSKVNPEDVPANSNDCFAYGRPCPNMQRCRNIGDVDPYAGTLLGGLGKPLTEEQKESFVKLKNLVEAKKLKMGEVDLRGEILELLKSTKGEHRVVVEADARAVVLQTTGKSKKVLRALKGLFDSLPGLVVSITTVDELEEEAVVGARLPDPTDVLAFLDETTGIDGMHHNVEMTEDGLFIVRTTGSAKKVRKALEAEWPDARFSVVLVEGVNPPDGVQPDAEPEQPDVEPEQLTLDGSRPRPCPVVDIVVGGFSEPIGKMPKVTLIEAHRRTYEDFKQLATGDQFRAYMRDSVPWNKTGKPLMGDLMDDIGLLRDLLLVRDDTPAPVAPSAVVFSAPTEVRVLWPEATDDDIGLLRAAFPSAKVKVKRG